MNLDYVVDVGIKGILATILAGVLLNVILKGYDKLKNDRDSDVFEEATTLFINSLLIYSLIATINSGLLYLIYEHYKTNKGIVNVTAVALIVVNTMTLFIPIVYFKTLTLLKNKFYLVKREGQNQYELLAKGYDIVNSLGFEVNNEIPFLSELNIKKWSNYRKFSKKYYDKQIKGCFYEIIYIHKHPIKRFVKVVPKLWVVSVFTIPVMYIILIILLGVLGNGLLLIWIIMIGLILLYVTNFLIFVRLSAYISKQNKTDQYIGYYKTNNLA